MRQSKTRRPGNLLAHHGEEQAHKGRGEEKRFLHLTVMLSLTMGIIMTMGFLSPRALAGTTIELSDANITFKGILEGDEVGEKFAKGDINGDGYDDLIIDANKADPPGRANAGQSYVIFGSADLPGTVELSTDADLTINGINEGDRASFSLGAGDVNGDGFADIIIGAAFADPGGRIDAGQTYVVFGSAALSGTLELSTDADLTMNGIIGGSRSGMSVAIGDVNADGIDDIIIGAPGALNNFPPDYAGQTYVVFGSADLSGTMELSTDADLTINGIKSFDRSGISVTVGDINDDGIADVIIGAHQADPGGRIDAGQTYVVFGSAALSGTIELSTDADLTINGIIAFDNSGISVATGDVNGDGICDIGIGAYFADPGGRTDAGQSYVVFGSAALSGILELSTGADLVLNGIGAFDNSGISVRAVDVNSDGYDDMMIGAQLADPGGRVDAGQSYVVFGSAALSGTVELSIDADLTINGINSFDRSGLGGATVDVNSDGYNDIVIGAHWADPGWRPKAGETYVMFGPIPGPPVGVSLVPDSTVVSRDSALGFQVTVANNTDSPQTFQFWTNVTLPNGSQVPTGRELLGPVTITLGPHASRSAHLSQFIPSGASLGIYTYHAYVGAYPTMGDQSDFAFDVVSP